MTLAGRVTVNTHEVVDMVRGNTKLKTADDQRARAAFDAAYESSTRGEHRYPDSQQSEQERDSRDQRDALTRKLGGAG